jgi:predicted short-subunit dehydrogenase-like oxidoreductase (DUF2520 family)
MIDVVFLGFGNVNYHLCDALHKTAYVSVKQIVSKTKKNYSSKFNAIPFSSKLSEIVDADVYIIGIPDDAIASFSESLPFSNRLVVHTSGGVSIEEISKKHRKGVFYPLQTFSIKREVDYSEIPICIEAKEASDGILLKKLGETISEKVVEVTSSERAKLHLAAVFVNNFVNHCYQIGYDILSENNLPFSLLEPLIAETSRKIKTLPPFEAQTGPAKRNDLNTIEKHLHLLQESEHLELYKLLTEAIQTNYGKKL